METLNNSEIINEVNEKEAGKINNLNNIKKQKYLLIFVAGSITFIIIYFILFNNLFNDYQYIDYIRTLFYGAVIIGLFLFLTFYYKDKRKEDKEKYINIINGYKYKCNAYEYIINDLSNEKIKSIDNQENDEKETKEEQEQVQEKTEDDKEKEHDPKEQQDQSQEEQEEHQEIKEKAEEIPEPLEN